MNIRNEIQRRAIPPRLAVPLLTMLLIAAGCEPSDPGSVLPNQVPDTKISVAPKDDDIRDHFVSPSVLFHIQWFGHDGDGEVVGYYLQIDTLAEVFTTATDSAIAFKASEPDPDNPGKTRLVTHTVRVSAVDNQGERDPDPATRTFTVKNDVPRITAFVADFPDSATTGSTFKFSVEWEDANPSGVEFRVLLDGSAVTEWDSRSSFRFCRVDDPSIVGILDRELTNPIDAALLTPGEHDLQVLIRDMGQAVGPPRNRHITVTDTVSPVVQRVKSLYGTANYYPDGSIFYRPNTVTSFELVGSASSYFGDVHSYRYRYRHREIPASPDDTAWSNWSEWSPWGEAAFEMNADTLSEESKFIGTVQFEFICRDWNGVESEAKQYLMSVVEAEFDNKTILVIDETKAGNGRPGSPNDEQCDDFYREILQYDTVSWTTESGWKVSELDYSLHKIDDKSYVSAKDVYDQRVILWHSDDKAALFLGDNIRILSEYLSQGGRLIISGWNVLGSISGGMDEVVFNSGFAYRYLRIQKATLVGDRDFAGLTGDAEFNYPELNIDEEKIPGRWDGMDNCWLMTPRHNTDVIGGWIGVGEDSPRAGQTCVVRNFNPVNAWKTIVLGFPLYFMQNAGAQAFISRAMEDIDL